MTDPRLEFRRPLLNAAGTLSFAPDPRGLVALDALGAFITNPISARRRRAAENAELAENAEGAVLHSGWPNPGLREAVRRNAARWARAELPIIVHLLGDDPDDMRGMATRVEELDNVAAIEVGLPPDCGPTLAADLCRAAAGERPVIAQLPFETALDLASPALGAGAGLLSLAPPRGVLYDEQGGRLYGLGMFPEALELVRDLVKLGAPVIGGGGIYEAAQARAMLEAGAKAIKLDTVLWKVGTQIEGWSLG